MPASDVALVDRQDGLDPLGQKGSRPAHAAEEPGNDEPDSDDGKAECCASSVRKRIGQARFLTRAALALIGSDQGDRAVFITTPDFLAEHLAQLRTTKEPRQRVGGLLWAPGDDRARPAGDEPEDGAASVLASA